MTVLRNLYNLYIYNLPNSTLSWNLISFWVLFIIYGPLYKKLYSYQTYRQEHNILIIYSVG